MKYKKVIIISIFLIVILLTGCIEPYKKENELSIKSVHKYDNLINIDGNDIYYFDENNDIQKESIHENNFHIIISNETYLYKQEYGGLMTFEQWTLYIKK